MDKSRCVNGITGHALVLGGSGGLGAEIVRTLAASGASAVSFTYGRNKKAADDLVAELRADGIKAFAAPADLSDEPGFNKVLDDAVGSIGQEVSLAISSIGISPNIPIEEQTLDGPEGWRRVFEINVFGCFISTRAIAERMKKGGVKGSIVHHVDQRHQFAIADIDALRLVESCAGPHDEDLRGALRAGRHPHQRRRSRLDRNQHERHTARRRACARDQQDLGAPLCRSA